MYLGMDVRSTVGLSIGDRQFCSGNLEAVVPSSKTTHVHMSVSAIFCVIRRPWTPVTLVLAPGCGLDWPQHTRYFSSPDTQPGPGATVGWHS